MRQQLLLAACVVWAAGAAFGVASGGHRRAGRDVPYGCGALGGGLVAAVGVASVLGHPLDVNLGSTLGLGQTLLRLDGLAGLFLTLAGGLAVAVSACCISWDRTGRSIGGRYTTAAYLLLLGSVTVIVVAGDAFTFLFAWESLTVAMYLLVATGPNRRGTALPQTTAAWVTFGVGKAGGASLLVGFLLLAGRSGSFALAAWGHVPAGGAHATAYVLVVVGFWAKVGVLPFQVWLPVGYPAAAPPLRAAMAGLAANVGFYGLWRFLGVLGRPPEALAVVVLVVGGLTALVGIAFAGVQSDLNRLVAYSSVENAGLISVGYGIALAGATVSQPRLVAVGLLAATLQLLAHAVAKTGLFSSAAFFTRDWGTARLDELRGVGHTHPVAGAAFGLGSLTLAGLPPTIGFVSEWFLLEALLQEFRVGPVGIRLGMATAAALVALTAGVAVFTFARLVGLTVLSRPFLPGPARAEVNRGGLLGGAALTFLAGCCVALAAFAPWVVRFLAHGLSPVVPADVVQGALRSPWVLQPVYAHFSALSPSWLTIVLPLAFLAAGTAAWLLSRGRLLSVRRVPAWRSASAGVAGADRYSSFGYASVLRHVLGNVLGTRRETVPVEAAHGAEAGRVEVRSVVVEPIETYLYRPARRLLLAAARQARRLQSGRLDAYVAYMLLTLVVVLVVAAVR